MADIPPSALAALAKKHLGLPPSTPDERVPRFFLDELRRHLMLYPLEDNFRVTLQPKVGLGTVTCLKDGCNEVVPLIRRVRAHDGGKADGLGSLSAYRNHLASHTAPTRRTRVKAEPDTVHTQQAFSLTKATVKTEPMNSSQLLHASSSALPPFHSESTSKRDSGVVRVKPEIKEPTMPRKRLSDTAFGPPGLEADDPFGPVVPNAAKKAKTEVISKTPFAQVTNSPAATTSQVDPMLSYFQDPSDKFDDVQIAIVGQQNLLDRIARKPVKSKEDIRKVAEYERELKRLRALEQQYRMFASAGSSSQAMTSPRPIVKEEPGRDHPLFSNAWNNGHPTLRKPTLTQSFPMPMDADQKPIIKHEQPVASGSAIPLSSISPASVAARPVHVLQAAAEKRPVIRVQLNNATASGSKGTQPAFPTPRPSSRMDVVRDDSDSSNNSDSDEDGYEYNPSIVNNVVNRLGIKAPAPIDDGRDDNGDFHGRGRDLFVGPQAAADDLEKFIIQAGNAEAFDGNASVDKALHYLELNHLHERIPGMEISLMAHQVIGVAWMLDKERGVMKGGCLADEMGLGKTVQMIATMLMNRSTDPACKTTLIIAPLALLDQWKEEIEMKTNCGLKCLIYHGSSRTSRKVEILKQDVVLTTFSTMSGEWPDFETEMKKKAKARKQGDSFIVSDSDEDDMRDHTYRSNKRKQKAGLLFQIDFFRIVTDEAQGIRNRRTKVSRAITDLRATYRWCLTGTPIVNTIADAYGYIRFLKLRPWYDWDEYQKEIGIYEKKRPDLAVARLQTVMSTFLLRRKKDSKLDGQNLIDLPEKDVKLARLVFSEEERDIYSMVEARSQAKFNRYLRAGTVLKNYHQVLVLLLRLRQICSHPSLIQEDGVAFVHPDEAGDELKPELSTEVTRARRLVSAEFVTEMKAKFKKEALDRLEAEKNSMNATIEEEECPICFDNLTEAVITSCGHIFCRECIIDVLRTAPPMTEADNGGSVDNRACPACRAPINAQKLFSREAFEPSDEDLNPSKTNNNNDAEMIDVDALPSPNLKGKDRKGKGKATTRPKRAANRRRTRVESDDEGDDVNDSGSDDDYDDDGDVMSDFIVHSDEDEEEKDARRALKKRLGKKRVNVILDSDDEPDTPEEKEVLFGVRKKVLVSEEAIKLMPRFLPSTKMKYMMDQLQQLVKTNPEEKTLIVSQWTGCLSLVSDYLSEKGIPHVKYQGDMNRAKRDQAVKVFMAKEKARVMLMSLKCGGVGLNLTRANNVISLDLGWSQAVESQAFDRVHRLGQNRKVLVQRLVIEDTVEDRILKMQERKQSLAEGSLGEGSGKKIGKLSVKELANLFGLDGHGRLLKH